MIRALLDKKYAFPTSVIDGVVNYFQKFVELQDPLPVLWYQSLLVFCQRYKNNLNQEQQTIILNLSTVKFHDDISPEIIRELNSASAMQP
jgi:essential nuclear protein 1